MPDRKAAESPATATFFKTAAALRRWLEKHHASRSELLLGFYRVAAATKGITYREALDEALCFGWIDGIRRGLDADSYTIRFTPRKAASIWSAVNMKRMKELIADGRVQAAGMAAWKRRDEQRSAIYSYEREHAALDADAMAAMARDRAALEYYNNEAPWYRRTTAHWVVSAKKPETRNRRLAELIKCSREGRRIGPLAYPKR